MYVSLSLLSLSLSLVVTVPVTGHHHCIALHQLTIGEVG